MERKPEIQYIRYYTDGSAARKLELMPAKKEKPVQKKRKIQVKKIYIDPLPVAGILLSCVLLICIITTTGIGSALISMIVGMTELTALWESREQMQTYVDTLREENTKLETDYREDLDMEHVEKMALSMGMIPYESAQHISVQMPQHGQTQQPGFWENVAHFLAGLFA